MPDISLDMINRVSYEHFNAALCIDDIYDDLIAPY